MLSKIKKYKKGTTIRLYSSCTFVGTKQYEDITLDRDSSEKELDEMAREFMFDRLQPEYWFVVADEDDEC